MPSPPEPTLQTARLELLPLDERWVAEHDELECAAAREHWAAHGFGTWAVLEQGRFVGVAEVHHAYPGVEGLSTDEVEVGWAILPEAQGRGVATEATAAAIADAWPRSGADHLVAYISPDNDASRRVAAKLGFRLRGPGRTSAGEPVEVYELRRGGPRRGPTLAGFAALGLFWGAWAAVLPGVQEATGLSNGALGLALLFVTAGAIPAMLLVAGPLVDRFGVRAVAWSCAAFAAATTLLGLAGSLPALIGALAVTGAASGTMDVGINASAARIEAVSGRRLMPLAHGLYSVGVLLGAVGAGLARGAGAGREEILLAVSVLIALTALWTATDSGPVAAPETRGMRFARALLLIGVVGAAAFVVEGGLESWSAVFLERRLGAEPAVSGLGPGLFGAAMAAGRFLGQASRFDDRLLLAAGSSTAAAGCMLAALAPGAPAALAGFVLGGLGISLNAPIVFGAAGRRSASAVATVTTLGYVGLLVGPPLVGGVAQASSLRAGFLVLAVVAAAAAAAATRLRL